MPYGEYTCGCGIAFCLIKKNIVRQLLRVPSTRAAAGGSGMRPPHSMRWSSAAAAAMARRKPPCTRRSRSSPCSQRCRRGTGGTAAQKAAARPGRGPAPRAARALISAGGPCMMGAWKCAGRGGTGAALPVRIMAAVRTGRAPQGDPHHAHTATCDAAMHQR